MDSQDSRASSLEKNSADTLPTQIPNSFASFNIPFQPNSHFDPRNDPYFCQYSYPFGQRYSYQALLNTPNTSIENTQTCPSPKKQKQRVRNTPKSNSQSTNPNWSKVEDIALAKAWLYVSSDADVGNGQKNTTIWNRIFESWKENMGTECNDFRNINSLGCRWQKIQQDVSKFHGYYERLERNPRSGTTPEDMKREAMRVFEDCNDSKPFKFEHCWEILKTNAKWCTTQLTKKNESIKQQPSNTSAPKTCNIGDEFNTSDDIVVEDVVRPQGRKGCKDKKRKLNERNDVVDVLKNLQSTLEKQIEVNKKQMEIREKALRKDLELKNITQKLKFKDQELKERAQRRKEQHRIMNQELSKLAPAVRQTYEIYQAKILKEWEDDGLFGNDVDLSPE